MIKKQNGRKVNEQFWNRLAIVAGVFSFVIAVLLIANVLQTQSADPVDTKIINTLVEQLSQDPNNEELKSQIREMDLLARKAFFTNQWQVRTGGYMLLLGVLVIVVAFQMIDYNKKIEPELDETDKPVLFLQQKKSRKWVAMGGGLIVVLALIAAFSTHSQLGNTFSNAALAANQPEEQTKVIEEPKAVVEEKKEAPVEEIKEEPKEEVKAEPKQEEVKQEVAVKEETKAVAEPKETPKETKAVATKPATNVSGNNFTTFRGPGGNGIAPHKNIPTTWDGKVGTNILWKFQIPLHGYNSPIIWGDKVFFSGADANTRAIYCLDKNSGKQLWVAEIKGIQGSPAQSPKVTDDTGHAAPTVTTDGKKVYAIYSNGDVAAVDFSGKMVWGVNLGMPQNHYGHSSSLHLYKGKLIVQYDHRKSQQILALSAADGSEVWRTPRKVKISWASPVLVNTGSRDEVIIASEPNVTSYDPETGKELWSVKCISGEVGPSVAYANGVVFAVNEYSVMSAIKLGASPEIIWESDEYLSDVPSPIATKDFVLLATSYGVVVCYSAQTGEKYWEQEFDNGFYSSPMLADEKVYLTDTEGITHIFKLGKEYVSVGTANLGEATFATPAFTEGRIYLRGDNTLYCIGQK